MTKCPKCQADTRQVKDGHTKAGSQRYRCRACGNKYTPAPKAQGWEETVRQQAVKLYIDGMNFRRIARQLGVSPQSVINWVNAHAAQLPEVAPGPEQVTTLELDEVFTFVGRKKTKLSL